MVNQNVKMMGDLFDPTTWFDSDEPATDEKQLEVELAKTQAKINELHSTQAQVDKLLDHLDPSSPLYAKLSVARAESRGFFETYLLPVWEEVRAWVSENIGMSGMGWIPLIMGAVKIGGIIASLFTVYQVAEEAIDKERNILNDPDIPMSLKQKVLGQGALGSQAVKYAAMVAGLAVVLYFGSKLVTRKSIG